MKLALSKFKIKLFSKKMNKIKMKILIKIIFLHKNKIQILLTIQNCLLVIDYINMEFKKISRKNKKKKKLKINYLKSAHLCLRSIKIVELKNIEDHLSNKKGLFQKKIKIQLILVWKMVHKNKKKT